MMQAMPDAATPPSPANPPVIRPAVEADLPALTELYNYYVLNTVITFDIEPFTVERRRQEWFEHYHDHGIHRLLVAVDEADTAIGYVSSSPFRPKAAYATSVETSIYLAPTATGRGLGSALYDALFDALADEDLHRAYAGIALPNDASVALHVGQGFADAGMFTEVGRKFGRYVDVAWMEKPLGGQ